MEDDPRFFADAMLGGLARWLRLLGFDTAYEPHIADQVLVHRARAERRAVLTQDRRMPREWHGILVHLVAPAGPLEQLREVMTAFHLFPLARPFTRCSLCNTPLVALDSAEAADLLPPDLREAPGRCSRCPACGRTYWEGSHTRRMRSAVVQALGRDPFA